MYKAQHQHLVSVLNLIFAFMMRYWEARTDKAKTIQWEKGEEGQEAL